MKRFLLKYSPEWALHLAKQLRKRFRRKELQRQAATGGMDAAALEKAFRDIGIREGDALLVHSSLSKIGYVQGGSETVIRSLMHVLGPEGTLLMPSFPAAGRNKDYLESEPVFDVRNTPSAMGIISETFRKMPGVKRSLHPTDAVCAAGPLAGFFTASHFGRITPYDEASPFRKLAERRGKILMLGTTLNGAGTSLHTLEDAVDFRYPVYDEKIYEAVLIDERGKRHSMKTKVHNPQYSARRNCDALKPIFEKEGALKNGCIGQAASMLIDAHKMLEVMLRYYREHGVTMYTPYGNKNQLA
ncbi:MAG: AAC(3) family N-acetyltransferase [Bacteroidia bacterium]|nr:AAC(3) family N-acetyltransferase [Bacteroidia bacterium]